MPRLTIESTRDAAKRLVPRFSHPMFYPLKGIWYFAAHPFLYPLLRARLLPCFLLSAFVLSTLFIWTYLPQVAFLAIFQGRHGAWLNATFLVLAEGSAITALLFEAFLVDEAQVDAFDAVLVNEGFADLVSVTRPIDPVLASPLQRLGKPHHASVYAPFSLRQIIEFLLCLPLNFIPWVGVPLFLWLTGYRAGPFQHWRYFKLKEWARPERDAFVKTHRLGYTAFGAVFLLLQLVPVASMLFLLTTSAGSALWAVELEKREAGYEEAGASVSPPPEYSEYVDDPV